MARKHVHCFITTTAQSKIIQPDPQFVTDSVPLQRTCQKGIISGIVTRTALVVICEQSLALRMTVSI